MDILPNKNTRQMLADQVKNTTVYKNSGSFLPIDCLYHVAKGALHESKKDCIFIGRFEFVVAARIYTSFLRQEITEENAKKSAFYHGRLLTSDAPTTIRE